MLMTALWLAYGSAKRRSSSRWWSSLSSAICSSCTWPASSASASTSCSSSNRSRACLSRRSQESTSSRFSEASLAIRPALTGSSQTPGSASFFSSSVPRCSLLGRSKMLLQLEDASEQLRRTARNGLNVHLLPPDHLPWQRLYFRPEPHQQGSLRPILPVLALAPTGSADPGRPRGP